MSFFFFPNIQFYSLFDDYEIAFKRLYGDAVLQEGHELL
jgi:hypothetical protein